MTNQSAEYYGYPISEPSVKKQDSVRNFNCNCSILEKVLCQIVFSFNNSTVTSFFFVRVTLGLLSIYVTHLSFCILFDFPVLILFAQNVVIAQYHCFVDRI